MDMYMGVNTHTYTQHTSTLVHTHVHVRHVRRLLRVRARRRVPPAKRRRDVQVGRCAATHRRHGLIALHGTGGDAATPALLSLPL